MTALRGILIDPVTETIEEVTVDSESFLEDLYRLCNCDMIELVTRTVNQRLFHFFIDEEGRLKAPEYITPFAIRNDQTYPDHEIICGQAVVLGPADRQGNTMPAPDWCTVDLVKKLVVWPPKKKTEEEE